MYRNEEFVLVNIFFKFFVVKSLSLFWMVYDFFVCVYILESLYFIEVFFVGYLEFYVFFLGYIFEVFLWDDYF